MKFIKKYNQNNFRAHFSKIFLRISSRNFKITIWPGDILRELGMLGEGRNGLRLTLRNAPLQRNSEFGTPLTKTHV